MRISDWSSDVCSSDLMVSALKRLRSVGSRHGSAPSRPITPLSARARMKTISDMSLQCQFLMVSRHPDESRDLDAPAGGDPAFRRADGESVHKPHIHRHLARTMRVRLIPQDPDERTNGLSGK